MRPGKGVRVVRGPDWCFGGQDGGPGHLGTVVGISYEDKTCTVRWDVGTVTKECRANDQEQDLRIVDNSHPDLEHNVHSGVSCDGEHCKKASYSGFRWKCVECSDYDLCTKCYMAGVHDRTHHFIRYDTAISVVVPVPPRKTSKWIKTYSMEPGARVKLTKHRKSATADESGKILKVTEGTSFASTVQVEWASGETTLHEIVQEKKSDLVIAHSTGHIYPDHLPLADLSERVNTYINIGDRVVVDMNEDTFRQIQKEYGGWNDQMEKLLGEIGVVEELVPSRAHVRYQTLGRRWIVCVNACSKVSLIDLGDMVKLLENESLVKKRQHRHGGWQDTMKKELGEIGQVTDIDSSGDLFVKFKTHTHLLNPSCCVKVCNGEGNLDEKTRSEVRTEIRSDVETEVKVTEIEIEKDVEAELQETDLTELETDAAYSEKCESTSVASTLDSGISDSKGLCYDFSDMEFDDMVADVGLRVVRGKDWKWDNQDGGDGNLGTIVMVGDGSNGSCPEKCVVVLWDSGYRNTYRAGYQDAYDLKIYDTAPVGVRHADVQCSECEETDLMGFVWQCTTCDNVTLCHTCYHGDVHDLSHNFLRIDKPGEEGKSIPKRERSRKVKTRGAFEGTTVVRGPDWRWDDQDSNSEGEVIAVVNFSLDTDRDAVEVKWKDGSTNVYRYGFDGSFDVKCLTPVEYGMYFKDHLPDFKIVDGTPAETSAVDIGAQPSDRFNPGDTVRIGVDPDVLQAIHKSGGNWADSMMDCIGKTGEVILAENDNITVKFDGGSWSFKEMALVKVRQFKKGDVVQVKDNEHEVQELQNGHGEWNQKTRRTLGKKGVVKFVDKYGDVAVVFGGSEFTFNPECLEFSQGDPDDLSEEPVVKPRIKDIPREPVRPRTQPGAERDLERSLKEATISGDSATVESILQQQNSLVNAEAMDKPLVHVACEKGYSDVVRVLVNFNVNLEVEDSGSSKCTPLLTAVINKQPEVVKVLLRARVRKNVCNANKQTAVHLATKNQDLEMLDVLMEGGFDINQQDALGDIPVADAIDTGNMQVIRKILKWPNLSLDFDNSLGFSPLHIAARKGNTETVDLILKKCPDLLNRSKRDGYTALHLAACQNHADIVQLLLRKHNVNTEMRTVDGGWTPLHIACMHQSKETVEMLIVKDGKSLVQVDSEDNKRNNSLHLCLRDERTAENPQINADQDTKYEIAKMLIDGGIQYNTKNSHGKTALGECVNESLQNRVRELVQGKDVRQKPRTANPTPKVCLSCNEDPANYILNPCLCYICNECGARKAKKCPNCSEAVQDRKKISVL